MCSRMRAEALPTGQNKLLKLDVIEQHLQHLCQAVVLQQCSQHENGLAEAVHTISCLQQTGFHQCLMQNAYVHNQLL